MPDALFQFPILLSGACVRPSLGINLTNYVHNQPLLQRSRIQPLNMYKYARDVSSWMLDNVNARSASNSARAT